MLTESAIRAIHNHVVEGSVRFDPIRNKQVCEIRTRGIDGQFDGNTRTLATSDLHQTFWTVETKKALDKLKAKAKRSARARLNPSLKVEKTEEKVDALAMGDDEPIVLIEDGEEVKADGLDALRALVAN
jgi:hypothetical protein